MGSEMCIRDSSKRMQSCNWSCRSGLPTKDADPARRKASRDRAQTAPSMRSANASEDKRWITGRHRESGAPSLTSSDAWLKESSDHRLARPHSCRAPQLTATRHLCSANIGSAALAWHECRIAHRIASHRVSVNDFCPDAILARHRSRRVDNANRIAARVRTTCCIARSTATYYASVNSFSRTRYWRRTAARYYLADASRRRAASRRSLSLTMS